MDDKYPKYTLSPTFSEIRDPPPSLMKTLFAVIPIILDVSILTSPSVFGGIEL